MKNWLYLICLIVIFSGCRDDEFDTPPTEFIDPGLTATHTIAEVKAMHILGEISQIEEDMILSGIIVADDESGNFYQRLVVQDETAGIEILIESNDLFNLYPVGRRIYLMAKDMWLGDFNGVTQIGAGTEVNGNFTNVVGIPDALISEYIVGGAFEGQPDPLVVSIDEINTDHISRLLQLNDVEFTPGSRNVTYADGLSNPPQTINQTIQDCNGNVLIMRNSGFSTFANSITPSGNGSVVGVYGVFGDDRQIFIRDTTDVIMEGPTCNLSIETKTIAEIRDLYTGNEVAAPNAVIEGIVISDRSSGNFNFQNVIVQEEGGKGIVLRYSSEHSFDLGMRLRADLTGGTISTFNELLQVGNLASTQTEIVSTGNTITPTELSVGTVVADHNAYESTLVKFTEVDLSGSTWGDGVSVSDGTGSLPVFTFFSANFSNLAVPNTANSLVAIVGDFNGAQLNLRNANDIDGGGNTGGGDPVLTDISSIQDMWSGSATTITDNWKIQGVVISDYASGNITGRNLVLQDGDRGIVIRFTDNHSYALGENLEVVVFNQELSDFNGLLQVNNVPLSNATTTSNGATVTPVVRTIAEIIANPDELESTLVQIEGASISGAATFAGSTTVTDATGSIPMFTRNDATFANSSLPSGAVKLTGIVSDFNGVQVNIRNESDIE